MNWEQLEKLLPKKKTFMSRLLVLDLLPFFSISDIANIHLEVLETFTLEAYVTYKLIILGLHSYRGLACLL